ncbi:MAG TPA: CDP-glucose 4,6-dehydratase [Bacteriovoracaceae bacterium]|nr:CDP-glucose 4,6-dehydratase [Bacteriovoracaceae bacterium]
MFNNIYQNRKVLVTGHSGFKGSWLVLWLQQMGANVSAISLPPSTSPNHWDLLNINIDSHYLDIRDEQKLRKNILKINPEIVFHLAAQPLVLASYQRPLDTWSTNVLGTANVLDACRELKKLSAIVVVTTDKCYENKEWVWSYREIDPLGGNDPYSASKASSELVAKSYRQSFFNTDNGPLLATARAGNVIGGGDWSEDRIVPDLVRATVTKKPLLVRSPYATRPWQHVLECLSGYLALGEKLLSQNKIFADAWNFGPNNDSHRTVEELLISMKLKWPDIAWQLSSAAQGHKHHEANLLQLDSSKARSILAWRPVWSFEECVAKTAEWYQNWISKGEIIGQRQLKEYVAAAKNKKIEWSEERK